MKVKICGITDIETAMFAARQGVDALGFVFAESKRKVTPVHAKEMIEALPMGILKVGVFVNGEASEIERIVDFAGLNAIQLHGDESPQQCEMFSLPVIKAFSVGNQSDLNRIKDYSSNYVLLDSPKGKYHGGNGVKFDWSLLSKFDSEKKVILAGGLNEENVLEAIAIVRPFMIDVSSGVETNGVKDLQKIKRFIKIAKSAHKEEAR